MLGHELGEVVVGVVPRRMLLEQVVEVGEHLLHRGPVLLGGTFESLLHPGEALVEELATQQVLDLLVGLAGLAALPVVGRQLAHRGGGRRGEVVHQHLAEVAVPVVHRDVAGQLASFGRDGLVQELAHLTERAVEVVALQDLAAPLGHPSGQVVEPCLVVAATSQELLHRPLGRVARHHVLPDRVERLGEVDGRCERVAAVVLAIAAHRSRSFFSQMSSGHWSSETRSTSAKPRDDIEVVRRVVAVDDLEPELVTLDEPLHLREQTAPDPGALVVGMDVELPHHFPFTGDVREVAVGLREPAEVGQADDPSVPFGDDVRVACE